MLFREWFEWASHLATSGWAEGHRGPQAWRWHGSRALLKDILAQRGAVVALVGDKSSFTQGITAEVLQDGHVDRKPFDPQDPYPVRGSPSLKHLFKAMLVGSEADAPGMFHRFPSTFPVSIK